MPININIDQPVRKPNVRPPTPPSKRGPLTFLVDIDESRGRDVIRNLTRGVDAIDDSSTRPTPSENFNIFLQIATLSLSVSSEFELSDLQIPLSGIDLALTLPQVEIATPDQLNLSSISVELANLISLRNDLDVDDDEFVSLTLPEPQFRVPSDTEVPVSSVIVDLTVPQMQTLTTGSQSKILESLIVDLVNEAAFTTTQNSNVLVEVTAEDIATTTEIFPEVASVDLEIEEYEAEVGGDIDQVSLQLTLPEIVVDTSTRVSLETATIDLTLDLESETEGEDLGTVIVEMSNQLGIEISVNSIQVFTDLEVVESVYEVGGNIDPITNGVELDDFQLENSLNSEVLIVELEANYIEFGVGGDIDDIDLTLSVDTTSNTEINIQLPENMVSTPDDLTTVT